MRTFLIWTASVLLTLGLAVYQESTGPTKPVSGSAAVGGTAFDYKLLRTHGGEGGLPVILRVEDPAVEGEVVWRRYPTQEPWRVIPLVRKGFFLDAQTLSPHSFSGRNARYKRESLAHERYLREYHGTGQEKGIYLACI